MTQGQPRRVRARATPDLARDILARDDEVDQLKDQVFRVLLTYMMADPATIERGARA